MWEEEIMLKLKALSRHRLRDTKENNEKSVMIADL
jgi:hypothetical protein